MAAFSAGCLLAIGVVVGLGLAGGAISRAWRGSSSAGERVAEALLATTALAIAIVQVLGFAGALRIGPVALAALGCGAVALLTAVGRASARDLARDLRAGARTGRRSLPLSAAGLLALLLAIRGLRLPELSWDGLTYHLTYPAVWLQTHRFTRFEAGGVWEQYESFPKGGEALFALAMLPFHADHFVHWVNLPLWVGIGCALRASLLRLGASIPAADGCTLFALACPGLSAYVTPAYVEVPMTFGLAVALAAATRALASRDPAALMPLWLGLALAGAIKITALAFLPAGLLVTLFALRAGPLAASLKAAAVGCGLGAVVLTPWYLHNLVQCGNPLYPSGLPGATDGPAAGTLANVWAVRETSVLSQAALGDILDTMAKAPWRVRYPLGPGWMFLIAFPASLVAAVWTRQRSGRRAVASIVFALLALAAFLVYLISPWNGVFREANTRFLMPALLASAVSLTLSAAVAPRWFGWAVGLAGAALVAVSLARAHFLRDAWALDAAFGAVLALLGTAVTANAAFAQRHRRRTWIVATVAGVTCSFFALETAVDLRAANRLRAYEQSVDLHPVARFPGLYRTIEALPPSRIALAVGDVNATEGWFFYPLFGSRLQHSVRYVDIERDAPPACVRRGMIRDEPDEQAWSERLRALEIDYLVVAGQPIEHGWVRSRSDRFRPVFQEASTVLYGVDRPALRLTPATLAETR